MAELDTAPAIAADLGQVAGGVVAEGQCTPQPVAHLGQTAFRIVAQLMHAAPAVADLQQGTGHIEYIRQAAAGIEQCETAIDRILRQCKGDVLPASQLPISIRPREGDQAPFPGGDLDLGGVVDQAPVEIVAPVVAQGAAGAQGDIQAGAVETDEAQGQGTAQIEIGPEPAVELPGEGVHRVAAAAGLHHIGGYRGANIALWQHHVTLGERKDVVRCHAVDDFLGAAGSTLPLIGADQHTQVTYVGLTECVINRERGRDGCRAAGRDAAGSGHIANGIGSVEIWAEC